MAGTVSSNGSGAIITKVGAFSAPAVFLVDVDGNPIVPTSAAGQTAANASLSSIDTKFPAQVSGGLPVTIKGGTPWKLISSATSNTPTQVNATLKKLSSMSAISLGSVVRFLKFWSKATIPLTTDVPFFTFPIPANTQGAGVSIPLSIPAEVSQTIWVAITASGADNVLDAVPAGEIYVNGIVL